MILDCVNAGFLITRLQYFKYFKEKIKQELSHDSIARLNCALPITKTISVIR